MAISFNKIAHTAATATKAFLGLGSPVNTTSITSSGYRDTQPFGNSGWMFDQRGGIDVYFSFSGLQDVRAAYENCAPVFSIVNKQAYAFVNGKTRFVDKNNKDSNGAWAQKMAALFENPNPIQNWKQFEAQSAIYLRLFGFCVILVDKPVGFKNYDATGMWIIPPYLCKFNVSEKGYWKIKKGWIESITISYGSEKTTITDLDKVIILKDISPGFDNAVIPSSPIQPIRQNINNLIGLYESKGALINYRGALGILTPEIDPAGAITPDPKDQQIMEDKLMAMGIRMNQARFIIANTSLKWQQIGISYRDMMLTEWAIDETQIICDTLVYPFKLLSANSASSSMNGNEINEFKKQLYDDFVIPFADMVYEQLSSAFHGKENRCSIVKDFSHVKVLQEDELRCAQTRQVKSNTIIGEFHNNVIPLKRVAEYLGEEAPPNELGDQYYSSLVQSGWLFGQKNVTVQINESASNQNPPQ